MQYYGMIAKSITFNYPQIFKIVDLNRIPWILQLLLFSIFYLCSYPAANLTIRGTAENIPHGGGCSHKQRMAVGLQLPEALQMTPLQ